MSASKKLATTLAAAGGGGLNVESVFSTYLYTGNGSTQTITNGIDLDGEGGLVWCKRRDSTGDNFVFDTERGVDNYIYTNLTNSNTYNAGVNYSFNADGFSFNNSFTGLNGSGNTYASWTFRKAPKFFDVVTYTGNNTAGREIAHNLGCVPGMIIIKDLTTANTKWVVYHKDVGATGALVLNTTAATDTHADFFNNTSPTDTHFTVDTIFDVNNNGDSYVAYLFAHNDGDGEFGESGDQDIIKCGSYTGNGGTQDIDLGFEPQYILVKNSGLSSQWFIFDIMRGWVANPLTSYTLKPHSSEAEATSDNSSYMSPNPTGFTLNFSNNNTNANGYNYIYIAIRRPMKTPESGTEVFAPVLSSEYDDDSNLPGVSIQTGFPVDAVIYRRPDYVMDTEISSRLIEGKRLRTSTTDAESSYASPRGIYFDDNTSIINNNWWNQSSNNLIYWNFRRAPGFFDVVCYTGDGASTQDITHNLGVAPEFIFLKNRDSAGAQWPCWHVGAPTQSSYLSLNAAGGSTGGGLPYYVGQNVTDTTFRVSTDGSATQSNNIGVNYIAYLFASLDGISKVGSYTGNGTGQTVDCGFSTGARFVLIKRIDSTGDWNVWDTERGIVASGDRRLSLNTTDAQQSGQDYIDPVSSGFAVTSKADVNTNGATYIFYAIA
jgi:hypothetical protein